MKAYKNFVCLLVLASLHQFAPAQPFYFGADLSYVNEMEDCGVVYKENNIPKDPYRIFADYNCNLVRLRLWHTPKWYDTLNQGKRYSDFEDVKRSIQRAKAARMQVLLNFHLSDNWADPSKQRVPDAWLSVVNNLPVLKDSLYNYVFEVLNNLLVADLLPEQVQIGNETNKGILLSPTDDASWTLNWNRNAQLFNTAIKAVRDVEQLAGRRIQVALHVAGPAEVEGMIAQFWNNGVRDFDIIGMSYYWAWHRPITIQQTGAIIARLRQAYPSKEVVVLETGYVWTLQSNDNASNIINVVHPDYSPASPNNQRRFLIDLAQEIINRGGKGLIYWEPAWVSSTCRTQWGQGSHQEHAAFFNFQNNLMPNGGIGWMTHVYDNLVRTPTIAIPSQIRMIPEPGHRRLRLVSDIPPNDSTRQIRLINLAGETLHTQVWPQGAATHSVALPDLNMGIYLLVIYEKGQVVAREKLWLYQY